MQLSTKNEYITFSDVDSPNECYVTMPPELRTASNEALYSDKLIDKDSPSALWTMIMVHLTHKSADPNNQRIYYYTKHVLSYQSFELSATHPIQILHVLELARK